MAKTQSDRFWELDLLRGSAVVSMIAFHAAFDLSYFKIYNLDPHSGPWRYLGLITAAAFVLAAGISLSLSRSEGLQKSRSSQAVRSRLIRRGLGIFCVGVLITIATYLLIGQGFVIFGVLHLIGLSTILAWPFFGLGRWNALMGSAAISLGIYLQGFNSTNPWLLWLGIYPEGLYTIDYFPLFPWFGVILLGIFLGEAFYPRHIRAISAPDLSFLPGVRQICFFGRNSLVIYLAHQPVLVSILWLSGLMPVLSLRM